MYFEYIRVEQIWSLEECLGLPQESLPHLLNLPSHAFIFTQVTSNNSLVRNA